MKRILCFVMLISSNFIYAQDPVAYLRNFDTKIYSLKNRGIKDFVVDIESSKLTKQMNDQQLFGKVEELLFRVYWTSQPERIAIEIIGLPDGFKEVKEELKASIFPLLENIIPLTMEKRFPGYKFSQGDKQREIIAKDTSGIAPIPSFSLRFDEQDRLIEVIGNKPVGSLSVHPVYEKDSFAAGKWVLKEQKTVTNDNGQTMTNIKKLEYGKSEGISVLSDVEVTTEYKSLSPDNKPVKVTEEIAFKNYKINEGEGLKHFLGESKTETKNNPSPSPE